MEKIEIEINGKKNFFEIELKKPVELRDLEDNYLVIIYLKSGKKYIGVFKRCDTDDEVIIKLLENGKYIGFDLYWVEKYYQGPVFNY
jgi:uncharacterized protein YuzE